MTADLPVQKALRALFVASPAVTNLVPVANIIDRHKRPAPSPSVILGDSQELDDEQSVKGDYADVFHDLHIWVREPSFEGAKRIAAALKLAILAHPRVTLDNGLHLVIWRVQSVRYLRDPDQETSHGVMTIKAKVSGVA